MMVVFMALEKQCCGMVVEIYFKGRKIQRYSASIIQTESEAVIGDYFETCLPRSICLFSYFWVT